MSKAKIIGYSILGIVLLIAFIFGMGYLGVGYTKTVGKAQKNAETEVFYETQTYTEGKRQDALKLYREYKDADSYEDKEAIKKIVQIQFANFDEKKLEEPLKSFIFDCKYQ